MDLYVKRLMQRKWQCGLVLWFIAALFLPSASMAAPPTSRQMTRQTQPRTNPTTPISRQPTRGENIAGVSLNNGRLSIDVRDQQLHTVLRNIVTQGNIGVRHLEALPNNRISMRFASLPVVQGLKRLFKAAGITSYVLVTETQGNRVQVKRMFFFVTTTSSNKPTRSRVARRPPPPPTPARSRPNNASVFEDLKANTAARRLLSQLVHPNEQVRERALERLIRLVGDDAKQAELLEFLEPLMEDLASEDKSEREEARQEIRKLLRR